MPNKLATIVLLSIFAGGIPCRIAAAAKELKVKPPSPTERKLADNFNRAKAPATSQAQQALQKKMRYEISQLTLAKDMTNYTQLRKALMQTYVRPGRQSPEARKIVVATLASEAAKIVLDKAYSPATRINCLTILAELDDQLSDSRKNAPPYPAKQALKPLVVIAQDAKAPVYLRAIALHGLER